MTLYFIRCFFLIISGAVGYFVGVILNKPLLGTQVGVLCGLLMIFLESSLKRVSVRGLSSMVFGLLLGVFMAKLVADIIDLLPLGDFVVSLSRVILTLVFSYLGAVMALRGKDEFSVIIPYVRFRRHDLSGNLVLLDTSAIIDGRILDVYRTNFIEGRLVVPRFILKELQVLSDSSDEIKRQKGRRGLELLRQMQNDPKIDLTIQEDDFSQIKETDSKLINLAKILEAKICTTDFNLSRVALLQKIEVLNIHELANALRMAISTGDVIDITLIKEGKEHNQAVGYLDDGTMIVVNDAKDCIGQTKKVNVTSVLSTQAGKMIFAKII